MRILRIVPVMVTLFTVLLAAIAALAAWEAYFTPPWTRDGTVRAYVVTMAPEISGRILQLAVQDNQLVEKGQLLMVIEPTDYAIAVDNAQANLDQAQANADNRAAEARRRTELTTLAVSEEEKLTYTTSSRAAQAAVEQARATLAQARVNLARTRIVSPVAGWVTNLSVREGDYATVGQRNISVVDRDSFWIDGYFEESALPRIHEGDRARARLIGWHDTIEGHVAGVARGIEVANATPNGVGLASVNPIFTWVRLAQRVPVRIAIDRLPQGMRLVEGQTASVQIDN